MKEADSNHAANENGLNMTEMKFEQKSNGVSAQTVVMALSDNSMLRGTKTGRWRKWWKSCFPLGFVNEFKQLMRLAVPVAVASLFTYTFGPVSIAFCGHLGKTELAAIGLAMSVFNVAGLYVMAGVLTACDTMFSQTYGSQFRNKMSTQLQMSFVLVTICCIPCAALYISAEPLLLLLRQNPIIASITAEFLLRLIPALVLSSWAQLLTKYIQNQNHVYVPLIIIILTNGVNALLHYILLYQFQLGLNGAVIAQTASYFFEDACFLFYIAFSKKIINPFAERSMEFVQNWGGWFRLAIPGLIMVTLEWTIFEAGGIVAGTIGERELAAQTVLISLDTISYSLLPHGFGTATGIRVGQYLGAQEPRGPRSCLSVALIVLWVMSPFYYGITMAIRWYLPRVFSDTPEVISMVADVLPIAAIFQLLDAANGVCSGILRGAGLQHIGALINFCSLYLVGGPVGICLVYLAKLSIEGLWFGLITGTSLQVMVLLIVCFRVDWNRQVELAMKRLRYKEVHVIEYNKQEDEFPSLSVFDAIDIKEGTTQHCTKKQITWRLVAKRLTLICAMLILLIVSVLCHVYLNLSDYFGPYCVHTDGSFITINANMSLENCTVVQP